MDFFESNARCDIKGNIDYICYYAAKKLYNSGVVNDDKMREHVNSSWTELDTPVTFTVYRELKDNELAITYVVDLVKSRRTSEILEFNNMTSPLVVTDILSTTFIPEVVEN